MLVWTYSTLVSGRWTLLIYISFFSRMFWHGGVLHKAESPRSQFEAHMIQCKAFHLHLSWEMILQHNGSPSNLPTGSAIVPRYYSTVETCE